MKVTYKDSMSKRKKYVLINVILLLCGAVGYFIICSKYSQYFIAFIGVSCLFGVMLIIQLFHVYELVTLHKKGVEFFTEDSGEFTEEEAEKEEKEKLFAEDYEYGKGGENLEFLLENGEYTYDTFDDKICPKCGSTNIKDWLVCSECGESLVGEDEEKEYCPNCGDERNDESDYCQTCGYRFDDDYTDTNDIE